MHRELEFKVWGGLSWTASLVFWGVPPYLIYLLMNRFPLFLAHPIKFLPVAALLFAWYALPFTFGQMVIRIRRDGDELIFSTIGRPPLSLWGPKPMDIRVPAFASFEWSRPYLTVIHGDIAWQFKPALFLRARKISDWFHEIGLQKPQGL